MFAVEKDAMAFETFRANFLERGAKHRFAWPDWLPQGPLRVEEVLERKPRELARLRGQVDLLAGGPPCQGFSSAGRRNHLDPRNRLFEQYIHFVKAVQPSLVVFENVPGMQIAHGASHSKSGDKNLAGSTSFFDLLFDSFPSGYDLLWTIHDASKFGVPQRRDRLIVLGMRQDIAARLANGIDRFLELIDFAREAQLTELGLSDHTTCKAALSDLEVDGSTLKPSTDPMSQGGYLEVSYRRPRTAYQRLMNDSTMPSDMDSMRLTKHTAAVEKRFRKILAECPKGVRMNETYRAKFGILKHRNYPMDPGQPGPTLTTLPDDILHYSEPRILTVREYARLQSFPDWFRFQGKFSTGGAKRALECPRYTQIGNAVPPLLARAIGIAAARVLKESESPAAWRKIAKAARLDESTSLLEAAEAL
jgi:DNA (cytosine-5)-methyltransferase 1